MNNISDSMITFTLGLYFEVHDAELFGGEGSVGYTNINVDLKVSALLKGDLKNYVEGQIQGVAEMCKVDKEKVIIISRTYYEEETEEEDDEEYEVFDYCGV